MIKAKVILIVTFISSLFTLITAGILKHFLGFNTAGFVFYLSEFLILEATLLYGFMGCRAPIFGKVFWRGLKELPVISLTFDDGPNEPYTSQVLDLLKKFDVKATFFVIGKNIEKFPEVVRREVQDGHEVENHTFHHQVLPFRSPKYIREQIKKTSDLIQNTAGIRPHLFRAPHGWRTLWLNRITKEEGCLPVAWTAGVWDTSCPGKDIIIKRCLKELRNGCILLLHDGRGTSPGADCSQLVEALSSIISAAKNKGYTFLKLSEMIQLSKKIT